MKEKHYNILLFMVTMVQLTLIPYGFWKYDYIFTFYGAELILHKHIAHSLEHWYHTRKHNHKKGGKKG